jgi:sodium transport system permease protein
LFAGAGGDPEAMKSWRVFSWLQVRSLIVTIGLPAVIAAFVLTRNPLRTLRLDRISPLGVLVAVLLAVAIHPFGLLIASLVQQWLPIQSGIASQLMDVQKMMSEAAIWQVLLVLAVTPAICEELAFRGVLLSGFNSRGRTLGAVVLSSLFFGLTHGVIQQSLTAALLGLVIGAVAVWSRSLWNCIAFHCTYNGLMFLIALRATNWLEKWPTLSWIWKVDSEAGVSYRWFVTLAATTSAAMLLAWFYYQREHSEEDKTDDEKPISRAAIPRPHTEALVTSPNPK